MPNRCMAALLVQHNTATMLENAAVKQRLHAQEQRHASELDQLKAHHKQQAEQ